MCFDIITINIRVSIRVRGLHLVISWAWDFPLAAQSIERKTVKLPTAHDVTNGKPFRTNIVYVHCHYMEVP